MALVIILIILGIFLLGVEVFLLPGITVAGIGALISCGFGIYEAFVKYGNAGGFIEPAAVLVLSVIMLAMGLRAKTWKRLALHNNIDGASQPSPEKEHIAAGDRGTTVTRLAPGGKVMLNGKTYEAKSIDVYIDPHREVEVIGFDNFTVVVKPLSRSAEEEA